MVLADSAHMEKLQGNLQLLTLWNIIWGLLSTVPSGTHNATHASNQADVCQNWPMSSSDSQNDERLGKKVDETGRLRPVIKFHVSSL